jgi:glycerol-3-phosphate dehydrogenase
VNAAGAWADDLLSGAGAQSDRGWSVSTAINLVTRQLIPKYAAGITSADQATGEPHLLFMVPWHGCSLIGTIHSHFEGRPDGYRPRAEEVESFVSEINQAYPGASLELKDVRLVHRGFLPAEPKDAGPRVRLIRRGRVIDHSLTDGLHGLITLLGVKYTTAREVAQRAVDLVVEKLGKSVPECSTHVTPLYGGQIAYFEPFLEGAVKTRRKGLSAQDMRHLVYNYGSEYRQVLAQADEDPALMEKVSSAAPVMKAQVAHAVRSEMAHKLGDVVFRRTELGSTGHPGDEALEACAATMAHLMGWSEASKEQELEEVKASFLAYL